MTKVMVTGHRPNKLGGYSMDSAMVKFIDAELRKVVSALDPATDVAICGMAQGVDQMYAAICMEFGIPIHAYIPFAGQESRWPMRAQKKYRSMLSKCTEVVTVSDSQSIDVFNLRNAMMVRNSDSAIAVWDESRGGTANTVGMIRVRGIPLTMIHV